MLIKCYIVVYVMFNHNGNIVTFNQLPPLLLECMWMLLRKTNMSFKIKNTRNS